MLALPDRIPLSVLPTPLQPLDRLTEAWGGPRIWVKRDDLTGFGVSGNKIRKLEFHFAAAAAAGATRVITCGAAQSNHCRATALAAARLGFNTTLFLRTPDGLPPDLAEANHLLQLLAGAQTRFITPQEWEERTELMQREAEHATSAGEKAWVIPEGASDALGMWGYVVAMQELQDQLALLGGACAALWHAASSGGTTAGMGWAADRLGIDVPIVACSVGDDAAEIGRLVERIWAAAAAAAGGEPPSPKLEVTDDYVGGGYGVASHEELALQQEATALTGLLFDPTYTGKALYGLHREVVAGRFDKRDNVVFWHTGGGFGVFSSAFDFRLSGQ